jgi:transcriptional regulator with XRE-family HTH domain
MVKTKKLAKKAKKAETLSSDLKLLGNRIRSLRIAKGYSNYENFAFENDIPRAQFGRYERGEDLRYSSLLKVCSALGISIQEFFSEGFE